LRILWRCCSEGWPAWDTISTTVQPEIKAEGLNNLYQSKSKSQLALDYSYASTLERMHLWKMNNFLDARAKVVLDGLSKEDMARGKKLMARAILSTDMVAGGVKRRQSTTTTSMR